MSDLDRQWGKKILLCDGAMGTQIAARLPENERGEGSKRCPEILNLSHPTLVAAIHRDYLAAGADIIETNSFGANRLTLADYGLSDRAYEMNRRAAEIARSTAYEFYTPERPRWVAGSIGPGSKLPSLRQISFEELAAAYQEQATGLIAGGVDLFIVETAQDMLQVKAALEGIAAAIGDTGLALPVIVQVTLDEKGRMLLGTPIEAVVAALEPYRLLALGINCGVGPDLLAEAVRMLSKESPFLIALQPNAGLPRFENGQVVYPQDPATFAAALEPLIATGAVGLVGGCCGTTPAHIRVLRKVLDERAVPLAPRPEFVPAFASLFASQPFDVEPRPLLIGERLNANGSKEFRAALLAGDFDRMVALAREQEREGAHLLDLNVAVAGRDERRDMEELVARLVTTVKLPLSIDTTDPAVAETALRHIGGRALINSTTLEHPDRAARMVALARRYGAALVMLTIDEEGMADTRERKLAVARKLVAFAEEHGLLREALFIDPLTFSIASGEERLRGAARETIEAVRLIKKELPGVRTLLGVSNVSYGLKPAARRVLTSLFLYHAVQAGLDAAIAHAGKIMPVAAIDPEIRRRGEALLFDERYDGDPLERFLEMFSAGKEHSSLEESKESSLEDHLVAGIVEGNADKIAQVLPAALEKWSAADILERFLLPAMREVGERFGSGTMQLPFVLRSAEAMKKAVDLLAPHFGDGVSVRRGKVLLATVKGDIHDIGKNLVAIILASNGWEIVDLGTDRSAHDIARAVVAEAPDFVGVSGLLVRSALEMKEVARTLAERGLAVPILCGGAALSASFVAREVAPLHRAPVVYAPDAFAALAVMEQRKTESSLVVPEETHARVVPTEISFTHTVPTPPFEGRRLVRDLTLADLLPLLNRKRLFRVRWQMKRELDAKETYERIVRLVDEDHLITPMVVYGYFPCRPDGDRLVIGDTDLSFRRVGTEPPRALSDYFFPTGDIAPLFAVTIGEKIGKREQELFARGAYLDYFLLHGLAAELAEALATWVHRRMANELGLEPGRGKRFSPGFSGWDDLAEQRSLFRLLQPEEIGMGLTALNELTPLASVTGLLVHHPQAEYL